MGISKECLSNNSYFSPNSNLKSLSRAVILDAEVSKPKKTFEKKKYPRVVNVLKESIGTIIITKRILDLDINLTVTILLALTPAIEK